MEESEFSNSKKCHVKRTDSGTENEQKSNNRKSDNSNSNSNITEKKLI